MNFHRYFLMVIIPSMSMISLSGKTYAAEDNIKNKKSAIATMIQKTQRLDKEIMALRKEIVAIQKKTMVASSLVKTKQKQKVLPSSSKGIEVKTHLINVSYANPIVSSYSRDFKQKLTTTSTPLKLLEVRKKVDHYFKKQKMIIRNQSMLEIGGNILGVASLKQSYLNKKNSDINLAGASLSMAALVNSWVTGLIKINYSSAPRNDLDNAPYRIGNSRFFLNTAIVTVGKLNKSPFYFSFGQMVVPFGNYSGTLPKLTSRLGKTLERAILIGYQQPGNEGLSAAIYGFTGQSRLVANNRINNGGLNLSYLFNTPTLKVNTGIGIIANIADSAGMQNTRAPFVLFEDWAEAEEMDGEDSEWDGSDIALEEASFAGFGKSEKMAILIHRVPGFDIYSHLTFKNITVKAEYTGAMRHFNPHNLSFNTEGARPQTYNIESAYHFKLGKYTSLFSLGYSRSYQALALNMPEYTMSTGLTTLINTQLTLGLIYRHEENYKLGNQAYGQDLPVLGMSALGRSSNLLTAQLGFKF
ncbi:MAG: hypothetical protein LEGION0398_MBIBDBAK_00082 [Legionellaceae bacterium]